MPSEKNKIHIGTSGWSYKDWAGTFYPEDCGQKDRLTYYATCFSCVEIDSTFYAIPSAETVRSWSERTPEHFRFALKVPGIVTHGAQGARPVLDKVLRDKGNNLRAFLDTASLLGEKLGPIVFQFPYFRVRELEAEDFLDRLEGILDDLPGDIRFAVELRNKGWIERRYLDILSRNGISAVLIDHPYMPDPGRQLALGMVTTDFAYLRLLGDRYAIEKKTRTWDGLVEDKAGRLAQWAGILREITTRHGASCAWAFANNHFAGHGPATSTQLISHLRNLA